MEVEISWRLTFWEGQHFMEIKFWFVLNVREVKMSRRCKLWGSKLFGGDKSFKVKISGRSKFLGGKKIWEKNC